MNVRFTFDVVSLKHRAGPVARPPLLRFPVHRPAYTRPLSLSNTHGQAGNRASLIDFRSESGSPEKWSVRHFESKRALIVEFGTIQPQQYR